MFFLLHSIAANKIQEEESLTGNFTVSVPQVFVVSYPWTRTEVERMQHGPWQLSLSGPLSSPSLESYALVFPFSAHSSVDGGLKSRQCHPVLVKPTTTVQINPPEQTPGFKSIDRAGTKCRRILYSASMDLAVWMRFN